MRDSRTNEMRQAKSKSESEMSERKNKSSQHFYKYWFQRFQGFYRLHFLLWRIHPYRAERMVRVQLLRTHATHSVRFYRSTCLLPLDGCVLGWCLRQIQRIFAPWARSTVQLLLASRCVVIILHFHCMLWMLYTLNKAIYIGGDKGRTPGHAKSIA